MNTIQTLIDAAALGSVYALMAVGIGLVFGVLRLVNFAYGQLIMAGAYALALTNNLNPALSILVCFGPRPRSSRPSRSACSSTTSPSSSSPSSGRPSGR